jgi:hypothetical protein
LTNRIRKAMQYGKSIDDVVKMLTDGNNGLYSNEWLIADTKTNEIAMFELGTKATKLWRSSKNEWFGNTPGFYWGCNNVKDLDVRLETVTDVANGRPQATAWSPSNRDKKWLQFYGEHRGKITGESGKKAFSTPPICARHSLDAKVTTTELMKDLKTLAVFGPPIAGTWQPSNSEKDELPEIVPLVPNDWTILHPHAPAKTETAKVADLPTKAQAFMSFGSRQPAGLPTTKGAWHGTLLPKSDADIWLTQGFAAYEKIVALELALRQEHEDGELTADDKERIAIEVNHYCWHFSPAETGPGSLLEDSGEKRARFIQSATAKGVLTLHHLKQAVGGKAFLEGMEEFGRDHRVASADAFARFTKERWGKDAKDFGKWLSEEENSGVPTLREWGEDPEHTTIVYGTLADSVSNREAAESLQKTVSHSGSNITMLVISDTEAVKSQDTLAHRHVLLIGGPRTNLLAANWKNLWPVTFASGSIQVRKEAYAHPGSAVIVAGVNPLSAKTLHEPRTTVVMIAGLSAEATQFAVPFLLEKSLRAGNVLVVPNGASAKSWVVK